MMVDMMVIVVLVIGKFAHFKSSRKKKRRKIKLLAQTDANKLFNLLLNND